ncbi:putative large polymerase protein [Anisopteromalus calandrae negative-strand RNA virus 2]|uniref:Replicase n=1 Tax=Anisopteromalus calandrae negative-strand RNA virus 2 TaxID=2848910 RepID=A0AAE7V4A2_9MONO|nr:putative large polymerase protein [Anisopteromalus calandrae negative-strand RNA virus 2]QWT43291.1 putative large polymerase protein [Anisopteromalus calandrae negative-strand RNA virus 2]
MEAIPDAHLQSPIRIDERLLLLNASKDSNSPPHYKTLKLLLPCQDTFEIHSERLYGMIFAGVYQFYVNKMSWVTEEYTLSADCSYQVLRSIVEHLAPDTTMTRPPTPELHIKLLSLAIFWEDIKNIMQITGAKVKAGHVSPRWKRHTVQTTLFSDIWLSGSFMIAKREGVDFVLDYNQVMMISDTIWARVNTMIFDDLLPDATPSKVGYETLAQLYEIFDKEFMEYGNNHYTGIKTLESVIFGKLIQLNDPFVSNLNFYKEIIDGAINDGFLYVENLQTYLDSREWNTSQLTELYGLYRHWGHPTVNEEEGCQKIKDIIRNRPVPNERTLLLIHGALIRQFCASFIALEGRWPLIMNLEDIVNPILKGMAEGHVRHMNLFQDDIPLLDWAKLKLGKELNFDYCLDYTAIIDDKSIAPARSDLASAYSRDALGYKPPPAKGSRRLLKKVLDTQKIDIEGLFELVRLRKIPLEWLIILLHAKERELKVKPRMFALLPMHIRLYFSITEKNIKDAVFKFYPQQTMTLSESDLSKRLMGFSKTNPTSSYINLYIMIDFKAWNTHWTKESTDYTFRLLDDLFGLEEIYTYSHEFFSDALIALASFNNPPPTLKGKNPLLTQPPAECTTLWYDHKGGFDGIRQKGWTLVTIGILLVVEHLTGIKAQKVGQADNQICRLYIPKLDPGLSDDEYIRIHSDHMNQQATLFMATLKQVAEDLGLKVKDDESAISSTCMVYGKEIIVDGSYQSQSIKKISRALTDVNEQYPSMTAKVAAVQSAGLSAAAKGHNPVVPCYYSMVLLLMHFSHTMKYSYLTMSALPRDAVSWYKSMEARLFVLLTGADMGCLPVQNMLDYLYRGHPDSLTSYTTMLYIAAHYIPIARKIYSYLQTRSYKLGEANPELLVSNPCSTNLKTPPLLGSKFRNLLEQAIIRNTKNRMLSDLFPKDTARRDKDLFEYLVGTSPLHPRFIHEIYRLTPTSTRLTFLAKFSNTKTARQMFSLDKGILPYDELELVDDGYYNIKSSCDYQALAAVDLNQIEFMRDLYLEINRSIPVIERICPTILAQDMRDYSWTALTKGKKIEGVTVPHPAHQSIMTSVSDATHTACRGSSEFIVYIPVTKDPIHALTKRGPYLPFVGSRTREKVAGRIFTVLSGLRPYKAAERAVTLSTWCVDEGGTLYSFLMELADARTNVDLDTLKQTSGYIAGGTMPHRLDDHVTKNRTANNFLVNITTHILLSTDNMGRFARGLDNYVMHFQGLEHYGMALINLSASQGNELAASYHLHYNGSCCEELIPDIKITHDQLAPGVMTNRTNPLLYANVEILSREHISVYNGFVIKNSTPPAWALACILLGRLRTMVNNLSLGATEKAEYRSGMVGVQEIYRIGLPSIIKNLALLLVLHIDSHLDDLKLFCSSIPYELWEDIASLIMLPEVLPYVMNYLRIDGLPDAFSRVHVINRALNMKLIEEVNALIEDLHEQQWTIHPPFHITPTVKIGMVLRMWARGIYYDSNKKYDIRRLCESALNLYYKVHKVPANVAPMSLAAMIDYRILKDHGYDGYHYICVERRLELAYCAPEAMLRKEDPYSFTLNQLTPVLRSKPKRDNLYGNYPLQISFPERSVQIETRSIEIYVGEDSTGYKLRKDQMYRLVGLVSTAHLKYLEIIIREGWVLSNHCVCVADGESSLGRMLSIISEKPIIYNSLVNQSTLPIQRGYRYIPGAFLDAPDMIIGGELAVTTGGDLTDHSMVTNLIALITSTCGKQPPSLITCDAESVGPFEPNILMGIVKSVCRIASTCNIDKAIIKFFCQDTLTTACVGGYLKMFWKNVRLVTVTFSSYENDECFWVCSGLELITPYHILADDPLLTVRLPASSLSFMDTLNSFVRERRSWSQPIQSYYPQCTNQLNAMSTSLGYSYNVYHSFFILTGRTLVFQRSKLIKENVADGLKLLFTCVKRVCRGLQFAYCGKPLNHALSGAVTYDDSTHRSIERYLLGIKNLQVIGLLHRIKNNSTAFIKRKLAAHLSEPLVIKDKNKVVIYSYKITDIKDWSSIYLKQAWRLVGGLDYKQAVDLTDYAQNAGPIAEDIGVGERLLSEAEIEDMNRWMERMDDRLDIDDDLLR